MKTRNILLPFIFGFITVFILASCKDDDEKAFSVFDIAPEHLEHVVSRNVNTIKIPLNTNLPESSWQMESTEKWLSAEKDHSTGEQFINIHVDKNTADDTRSAQLKLSSVVKEIVIMVQQFGMRGINVEGDLQIMPTGGKANQCQSGYDIDKSFDGKFTAAESSNYHSPFAPPYGSGTTFPVTLEYFFDGTQEIDYLMYYTRSGNGNFGKLEIYTATGNDNYIKQGDYDFKEKNDPSKVKFSKGVKATRIKFVINSGKGGFASCDEMHFFNSNQNSQEAKLLKVFKDITCSEVKEDATEQDIQALGDQYLIELAQAIRRNVYSEWEKNFRIREYKAYSDPAEWAKKLMTKRYSNLDNLTGIAVEKDDDIVVFVGDTHGYDISLQCIGEEETGFGAEEGQTYPQTAASGDYYLLSTGINKFKMKNRGQLFVMYNCDLASHPEPIKIHIPVGSGKVSGFFDLKEHKTDLKYAELLSKATDKYFGVRGDKIIFYFHREKLQESVKNEILSAIHLWDDIIGWQQELMGIENVRPNYVNNHIFAISPEGAYMWASDDRIAFVYTYLNNVLLRDKVMEKEDNAWGPAHEIGHIHQAAIDWPSSTESSNNLFSNYVLYKLGKYRSRGTELNLPIAADNLQIQIDPVTENREIKKMTLSQARCVLDRPWCDINDDNDTENTDLHMRMNWQLWNYYHRCGHKPDFWPQLFKRMREESPKLSSNPGEKQLLFARLASEVAQEDLTEFFEMWGFFKPVTTVINQYGSYPYVVMEYSINQIKLAMSVYPKAKPFYYLEDRKAGDAELKTTPPDVGYYTQFIHPAPITKDIKGKISGRNVSITNGDEAVAFELREGGKEGKILYFSNFFNFEIPAAVNLTNAKLYAVQADGERKLLAEV